MEHETCLYLYEGESESIHNVFSKLIQLQYKTYKSIIFYIVSLLFNALGPKAHKLYYGLIKTCFWLSDVLCMHLFLHCNGHCLLLCPSLDSVPGLALMNPKTCQCHFSCWQLSFWLFFGQRCQMFPFRTLPFTLWHSKALFLYCAESLRLISAPSTYSANKNWITACCHSLVHMEMGVAMLILLQQHNNHR
jgi:TM2 domain-containing membrane protein YozV